MTTTDATARAQHKQGDAPDEVLTFEKAKLELYQVAGGTIGRITVEPGWRWTTHMKHVAQTDLCAAPHFQYHLSGVIRIRMADGTEFEPKPGDITFLPEGHDAWVVGNEPCMAIDWYGASKWGQPA